MSKVDKEAELKRAIAERNKVASEWINMITIEDEEESSSSSSMFMNNIESNRKGSEVSSYWSPTLIEVQIPDKQEEVHSSPTTDKIPSERHLVIQEEEKPSSYNME